jgi:hypothetical protein
MATIEKTQITSIGKNVKNLKLCIFGGNAKFLAAMAYSTVAPQKIKNRITTLSSNSTPEKISKRNEIKVLTLISLIVSSRGLLQKE